MKLWIIRSLLSILRIIYCYKLKGNNIIILNLKIIEQNRNINK